jgi:transcription elongation factor Elf1
MTIQKPYPEIRGTRTGYVIRFTCPSCAAESIIVNKMPKDHFRDARVASCRHCRARLNVLTPGRDR